jgi:dihydroorotate dehydrogenase (NAD+) catalytic subunit
MVDLSVKIGALTLKNPVITASGTFGYGTELSPFFDISRLGALVTKTITLEPRAGNPMPRIAETTAGMLNSIGLANVGVERFILEKLPLLENLDTSVWVNVAGSTIQEYADVVKRMDGLKRIDAFEVNISCPNVKKGGLAFGTDPVVTESVVAGIRKQTDKPVIVKLTPNVTDIREIASAAVNGGADALSLINTILGMRVDIRTRKPMLARVVGGLSGPAIKPAALAKVYRVAQTVRIPVIGIGGIMRWEDAVEFILAGASAVQVGTLNFVEPDGAVRLLDGLQEYCQENGIQSLNDIRGAIDAG